LNDQDFNWRHAIRDLLEWSEGLSDDDLRRLGYDQVAMIEQAHRNLAEALLGRDLKLVSAKSPYWHGQEPVLTMGVSRVYPWDFYRATPEHRIELASGRGRANDK
jgi:hypothetical protein